MNEQLVTTTTNQQKLYVPAYEGQLTKFQDGTLSRYHLRTKMIVRDEEVQKAAANKPFADLADNAAEIQAALQENPQGVQNTIAQSAENFLHCMYPMLEEEQLGFRISFSLDEEDDPQEVENLVQMVEKNRLAGLENQATEELPKLLRNFSETRGILRYMRKSKLLMPHCILSEKHLPTFLATAPVWFVDGQKKFSFDTESDDPRPDEFVKFMVKRLGTRRLGDWFQMWNRRSRPFSLYQGDAMPNNILNLILQAKDLFDYVVIATPYHNIASQEWADPTWQKLIDPYLLGFSEYMPSMFFFLGRWSNTGIFPLANEMLAHTMAYLEKNKQKLENFNQPYWTFPSNEGTSSIHNDVLMKLANEALKAYKNEKFFEWFTEGKPLKNNLN